MSVLLSTDTGRIQQRTNDYNKIAAQYQLMVNAYNTFAGTPLTNSNFAAFLADPITFTATAYMASPAFGGIAVDPVAAFNLLVPKTANYNALLAAINQVQAWFKNPVGVAGNYANAYATMIQYFQMNGSGVIVITSAATAAITTAFETYASSPNAIKMVTLANTILAELATLGITSPHELNPNSLGAIVDSIIRFDSNGFSLNINGIIKY